MDSGNSGSLQSSSGGDDDYNSHATCSSFINHPSGNHLFFNPLSQSQQPSPMFDPLSNYFVPQNENPNPNPNSLLNMDTLWPKSQQDSSDGINPFFTTTQTTSFPQLTENISPAPSSSMANTNTPADQVKARNPKKRSRASRRAPTTVLTTDTTNFRAMVQEFTGIPAPPFASSSPFPRSRLDLFGTPSSIRSNLSSTSQPLPPPPYHSQHHNLLRPFAQKIQPFILSCSPSSLVNDANDINASTSNLVSELGLLKRPRVSGTSTNDLLDNNMQMQNQIISFQSFLQSSSSPKYPAQEIHSNDSNLKMGVMDEFGLSQGQVSNAKIVNGLPDLVASDGTARRNDNGVGVGDGNGNGYNFATRQNGKVNPLGSSSSNFQGS